MTLTGKTDSFDNRVDLQGDSTQVVVIGGETLDQQSLEKELKGISVNFCSAFTDGLEAANQSHNSVFVVEGRIANSPEVLLLLDDIKHSQPDSAIVLIRDEMDVDTLIQLVNQGSCFQILTKGFEHKELLAAIQEGIRHTHRHRKQHIIFQEIRQNNRVLERLNRDLEKIVAERTYHIEISKQEIEHKISKIRHLLRFIKDVHSQRTIDDLIGLIRREIRRFHKVGDPVVVYRNESRGVFLVFFRQSKIIEKPVHGKDVFFEKDPSEGHARSLLANFLERPVTQTLCLPVLQDRVQIYVEHAMSPDEVEDFMSFIEERIEPVRMSFDRVLFDEQVALSTSRWEKTFDGIRDPVCIVNSNKDPVFFNKAFAEAFPDYKSAYEFPNHREDPVFQTFESGEPRFGKLSRGEKIYEVHCYPIRVSIDGTVDSAVNYYTNVTSERQLYSRMIQNEKMGAIGLLAGNIAHELNNPLTGIRSLAQTLQMEIEDERMRQDLLEIERAASRSQRIIKDLLDFSKGDGGKERLSLDQLIEKTLPMLKTALGRHRLFLELSSENHLVEVEPNLMQQVIFNLVNNACQAMESAGELYISTSVSRSKTGDKIRLKIKDTGPGIPRSHIDMVFEPFFTTKGEGVGTGLGLSMSKSIVTKFGGTIGVESHEGVGSTFTVEFEVAGSGV